jgi:hypothetical protein
MALGTRKVTKEKLLDCIAALLDDVQQCAESSYKLPDGHWAEEWYREEPLFYELCADARALLRMAGRNVREPK